MSAGAIGVVAGLLLAALEFAILRKIAERVDRDETRQVLRVAGLSQFVIFPVIGFFAARAVFGD